MTNIDDDTNRCVMPLERTYTLKVFQLFYRGVETAGKPRPTLLVHGNANVAYLDKSYFTLQNIGPEGIG